MNRRELIKQVALLTGAAVAGSDLFLSGCQSHEKLVIGGFTERDISLLDDIAETILPKTDTPGAREAAVGKFMAFYSSECYNDQEQKIFTEGIKSLDETASSKFGSGFMKLEPARRKELLETVDAEAKQVELANAARNEAERKPHYFTLMKQMVLLGFFTSKPGVTQVLRYNPVPGKYVGCIDYKGETSWA